MVESSQFVLFSVKKNTCCPTPSPSYSPDLAQCDYFLFPKLKFALKVQRFQDVEEIKANTAAELKVLISEQFQRTFEKWQDRWDHCILSGGEYFEGDIFK